MADRIVQFKDKDDNLVFPYAVSLNNHPAEWFTVVLTEDKDYEITSKLGNTYKFVSVNSGTGFVIENASTILATRVRSWFTATADFDLNPSVEGQVLDIGYSWTVGKIQNGSNVSDRSFDTRTASLGPKGWYFYPFNYSGIKSGNKHCFDYSMDKMYRYNAAQTGSWLCHWKYHNRGQSNGGEGGCETPGTGSHVPTVYAGNGTGKVKDIVWICDILEVKNG